MRLQVQNKEEMAWQCGSGANLTPARAEGVASGTSLTHDLHFGEIIQSELLGGESARTEQGYRAFIHVIKGCKDPALPMSAEDQAVGSALGRSTAWSSAALEAKAISTTLLL